MSYTRVMVLESPLSRAEARKRFRKNVQPALNAAKKAGILKKYSFVETGEHSGMLITEFDTKAKMNKYAKAMSGLRSKSMAETGMQSWIYSGPVKASG